MLKPFSECQYRFRAIAASTVFITDVPKRQRGRVKDINDDAFFESLPDAELKAWEGR